jgi:hypothetical protein
MKKILPAFILFAGLLSCSDNSSSGNTVTKSDTTGDKNPDGVVNSSPISTDSSAWKVDSNAAKTDSTHKHK